MRTHEYHRGIIADKRAIRMLEESQRSWFPGGVLSQTQVFLNIIGRFENTVDRLNMASAATKRSLKSLHALLNVVESIARDELAMEITEYRHLLSTLWTFFGGNRKDLACHSKHIACLEKALAYEETGVEHVTLAAYIIDGMSKDILRLKRDFSQSIDPTDTLGVEVHYEVLVTTVKGLMEVQANRKDRTQKIYDKYKIA